MERELRAHVATFYAPGAWDGRVELDEAAAHHASVKRSAVGDRVRLTGGDGRRALATVAELGKRKFVVAVDLSSLENVPRPAHVELWAPVGDRDRMLMLAEKSAELGVTRWQPVIYARSRSVAPRGEGAAFRDKVRMRQVSALEQSGSAWLPESCAEEGLDALLAYPMDGSSLLLDASGEPAVNLVEPLAQPVRIALGPEGGIEDRERDAFIQAGWRLMSLGPNVLRFETAGIAALAIIRSHLR